MTDTEASRRFVLSTQDPVTGGLAKWVDTQPDPLHTYLGLSGLGLQGEDGVQVVDPGLNISLRARRWLEKIHSSWGRTLYIHFYCCIFEDKVLCSFNEDCDIH